jgi:hypothetical protein
MPATWRSSACCARLRPVVAGFFGESPTGAGNKTGKAAVEHAVLLHQALEPVHVTHQPPSVVSMREPPLRPAIRT